MKLKKIFIGALLCLLVFFIYLSTVDKKVYYLSLGGSLAVGMTPYGNEDYGYSDYVKDYLKEQAILETYVTSFAKSGYRTTDLLRDIEENKKVNKTTIKNALIKADLVTLSIGFADLYARMDQNPIDSNINYDKMYQYADEALVDLDRLFTLMREYCKEDIIMVGYYNPRGTDNPEEENFYFYVNNKLKKLCDNYHITFIGTYEIFKENHARYLPNPNNIHPSKDGYQAISKEIIAKLDKKL